MDVAALAQYFSGTDQKALPVGKTEPGVPIIAAPRDFLKAAMRAQQSLQVILVSSLCCILVCLC